MRFEFDEVINFPAETVMAALRDRAPELAAFLPDIEQIETVDRSREPDGRLLVTNLWQGKRSSAPRIVRPFVTTQMLQWRDMAAWDEARGSLSWRFEPLHWDALFRCEGINRFIPLTGGRCQLVVTGNVETFPERVPGITSGFGRRIAPKTERSLINLLVPNMERLPGALTSLLSAPELPTGHEFARQSPR